MTNKDLISQYVDTGIGIPKYQFDKLSNNDKKTYLRKMVIRIEGDVFNSIEGNLNLDNLDYYYGELPESTQIKIVSKNGNYLPYITKNPSQAVQLVAVNNNGMTIRSILNLGLPLTEEIQLAAVNNNGYVIEYIKNPSEEVQLEAVKKYGEAIQFIQDPSEEVQMAAVKARGYAIQFIQDPSEEVQLTAVRKDDESFQFIKKPTEKVQLLLLGIILKNGEYKLAQYITSEKIQMLAVEKGFENAKDMSSVNYELINNLVTPSENTLKLMLGLQNKIVYNSMKQNDK